MADQDPGERIVIKHPDIEVTSVVTRRQLDAVWAEKGFQEVKGADPANPSPAPDALPVGQEPASESEVESTEDDEATVEESPKRRRRNLNG